jgi:hypothetical protein
MTTYRTAYVTIKVYVQLPRCRNVAPRAIVCVGRIFAVPAAISAINLIVDTHILLHFTALFTMQSNRHFLTTSVNKKYLPAKAVKKDKPRCVQQRFYP